MIIDRRVGGKYASIVREKKCLDCEVTFLVEESLDFPTLALCEKCWKQREKK